MYCKYIVSEMTQCQHLQQRCGEVKVQRKISFSFSLFYFQMEFKYRSQHVAAVTVATCTRQQKSNNKNICQLAAFCSVFKQQQHVLFKMAATKQVADKKVDTKKGTIT